MIKSILKIGLLLVVGILGYNYFFGTAEEKAQAKGIINKGADVGKDAFGLLRGEVAKFKSGKYDDALDKIGGLLDKTKEKVKDGGELMDKIEGWQDKKDEWMKKKEAVSAEMDEEDGEESEAIKEKIKALNDEAKELEKEGKALKRASEDN